MPEGSGREREWLVWSVRGLIAVLCTAALGINSWSLIEQINNGKLLAAHEVRLDGHDVRITGVETWRNTFRR